jgi:hypothetical protein
MSEENVEAVRELFERFAEIEFERIREAFEASSSLAEAAPRVGELGHWQLQRLDPEIEIDASAMPGIPEGNLAHGHQGWFQFWRAWLTVWESFEYEPRRWHDDGDHVVGVCAARSAQGRARVRNADEQRLDLRGREGRPPADVRHLGRGDGGRSPLGAAARGEGRGARAGRVRFLFRCERFREDGAGARCGRTSRHRPPQTWRLHPLT